jgi:colanic acid biosynthesis glycosyl transferase WcaI
MHSSVRALRIQLWSYNYDPEPTGIGPVSRTLAEGLRDRGHHVVVVAAHPHYPEAVWGRRARPYRERRNGIHVIRLPLWIGRQTAVERYRQELSFMTAEALASPLLPAADVVISASPSFPALLPAIGYVRARRVPWLLWLHDILPDGAAATGLVEEGLVLQAARWLERKAYARADRIVVLSSAFTDNLVGKGVPASKIELIYDPATRTPTRVPDPVAKTNGALRVLSMGNIGYSQGLAPLVDAFEAAPEMKDIGARLVITGNGMAADDVGAVVRSDRVQMRGVVDDTELESELLSAQVAFVSQQYEGAEFNIPSKLMNFMAYGLPVLAAVNPAGEVARIVEDAGAGWVVNSADPAAFPNKLREIAAAPDEVNTRARNALAFANQRFTQDGFSATFEAELERLVAVRTRP